MSQASALSPRFILVHKQTTSARVRFLRLADSLLAFEPLPAGATLGDADDPATAFPDAAALVQAAATRCGLPAGALEAVGDFRAWVQTPAGDAPILLAAFTGIDPPFAAADSLGGKFIAMTEARSLPDIESQLLRLAYEHLLG